jgi:hypothetical protein
VITAICAGALVSLVSLLVFLALVPLPCSVCGEPADDPLHFGCRYRKCPGGHHTYRATAWPSLVVLGLVLIAAALLVLSF